MKFTSQDRDARASVQTVQTFPLIQLAGTIERALVDHQTNSRLGLDRLLDLNSSEGVSENNTDMSVSVVLGEDTSLVPQE